MGTTTSIRFTSKYGTNLECLTTDVFNAIGLLLIDDVVDLYDHFAGHWVLHFFTRSTTVDTHWKCCHFFVAVKDRTNSDAVDSTTVALVNDHILRNVYELTSHVTGVSSLKRCIRKSFTRTVSRNEVLKYGKTFTEVRSNWAFDDLTRWLSHQTTHTCELLNLCFVTTSTRVNHHEEWVWQVIAALVLHLTVNRIRDVVRSVSPNIHHLLVAFVVGNHTVAVKLLNLIDFCVCVCEFSWLFFWNHHVNKTNGSTRASRFGESESLKAVERKHCLVLTSCLVTTPDHVADLLLTNIEVDETNAFRPDLVETHTTKCGLDNLEVLLSVNGVLTVVRVTKTDEVVVTHLT